MKSDRMCQSESVRSVLRTVVALAFIGLAPACGGAGDTAEQGTAAPDSGIDGQAGTDGSGDDVTLDSSPSDSPIDAAVDSQADSPTDATQEDGGADTSDAESVEADSCVAEPEVCDGIDQDCDGIADNGDPGGGVDCDTGLPGVCAAGTTHCQSGAITCVQRDEPSVEVCDGKDNDCNGETDEGDPGGGTVCPTSLLGPCAAGTTSCVAGSVICVPDFTPAPEVCDGVDNDCNGVVDDGDPGGGVDCDMGLLGVCAAGVDHCGNGALYCQQSVQPSAEVCNGLDDNCDGTVDEGDPQGGVGCATPMPGVCHIGVSACVNGTLVCNQTVQPAAEVCNELDDDCDGVVDNGDPGGGVACTTGKQGVCAPGTTTCSSGTLMCKQNVQSSSEVCDGKDNDCDGEVDDNASCGAGSVCSAGTCRPIPAGCTGYRFGGHAYAFCANGLAWSAAEASCVAYGAHLTSVGSSAEDSFIRSKLTTDTWIGLYRTSSQCGWRWSSGEAWTYQHWSSGQPDGSCGNQDCVQMWWNDYYLWDNMWCNYGRAYVCEWDQ